MTNLDNLNTWDELKRREKQREFNLIFEDTIAKDDTIMNTFLCTIYKSDLPRQGKLFLTNRNLCFASKFISERKVVFPFEKITEIERKPSSKRSILIKFLDGSNAIFGAFVKRDQTLSQLQLLCSLEAQSDKSLRKTVSEVLPKFDNNENSHSSLKRSTTVISRPANQSGNPLKSSVSCNDFSGISNRRYTTNVTPRTQTASSETKSGEDDKGLEILKLNKQLEAERRKRVSEQETQDQMNDVIVGSLKNEIRHLKQEVSYQSDLNDDLSNKLDTATQELETLQATMSKERGWHLKPWNLMDYCEIKTCNTDFDFFNRRHHCRKCCKSVCNTHSSQEAYFPAFGASFRICDECFDNQ